MKRIKVGKKKLNKYNYIIPAIIIVGVIVVLLCSPDIKTIERVTAMLNGGATQEEGISVTYQDTNRMKYNFDYGWIFSKGSGQNNSQSTSAEENVVVIPNNSQIKPYQSNYTIDNMVGVNGETWKSVSLPHTYNDNDTFDTFTEPGYNGDRTTYSGTAWYKKTFYIPAEYSGKKIYVEFEAARQAAKIYVNGTLLTGTYENGFIPFGYDITSTLNYGAENDITVLVDNTFPYYMEGTSDVVSWHDTHWHPNYGGLYRNSYLYVVDNVHLTLPLYSFLQSEGTYIYTTNETASSARINIEAQVENNSQENKQVKLVAYIKNMDEVYIKETTSNEITLASGEKATISVADTITNAIRWSTTYPYLYTVECKLISIEDGQEYVVDNNETQIGIRTFRLTNDKGAYLNGTYLKLNGWGQKPTSEWAGLGAAYPDWMTDYVIELMKNAGSNFVRWGHCAGSPTQVSAADKYGIITLQPGVDGEGETVGGSYTTNTYRLRTNAFRDMIIYYRNNPSILLWEMGNQIVTPSVAATMVGYIQQYDHGGRSYTTPNTQGSVLYNDTEIVLNSGTHATATEASTRLTGVRRGIDLTMVPYVSFGETTEGGGGMNTSTYGNKPEVEGEYNRLEARRGVWDIYTEGYENFQNSVSSESFSAYIDVTSEIFATSQASSYASMIDRLSHCGGANWIFSDSISHGRVDSEVARASGEVDGVMLPKESYWVTKVLFSTTSGAHIIGHWNYSVGTIKTVYVAARATNATSATLKVTEASSGIVTEYAGSKSSKYMWVFHDVIFEPGTISVEIYDALENLIVTDSKSTHQAPASLRITPITSPNGLIANGSDVLLLDVEVLDSTGTRCNTFDGVQQNIYTYFTVNNQPANVLNDDYCEWRGGYNSGIEHTIEDKQLYIESGITRVALRTTMNPGAITVTATMTLENGTVLTDTCTVNSTSMSNTNGYTSLMPQRLNYSLESLTQTTVGDGTAPDSNEQTVISTYASQLVEGVTYTGTSTPQWSLQEVLENGEMAYCDTEEITFTSIPYKYQNAEYLKLPSVDNGALAVDLINFTAIKNIDIIVLRDPAVENPAWLAGYTLTNDIVTTSDGKVYRVYRKSVTAGTGVNISGNADTAVLGSAGAMNIIAFKETSKINNQVFFEEKFQNYNDVPSINGWHTREDTNTEIVPEMEGLIPTIRFTDVAGTGRVPNSGIAYIYKRFAKLYGNFTLEYDLKVENTLFASNITNKYIRVFLYNGTPTSDINARENVVTEMYFMDNTSLVYRNSGGDTNYNIKQGIAVNTWHHYLHNMNVKSSNFTTEIDSAPTNVTSSFYAENREFVNYIQIGSGNSSLNNFVIGDVKITPKVGDSITGITVGGNALTDFHYFTKAYLIKLDEGDADTVQIIARDANVTSTVTYNENRTIANVTVNDSTNGTILTYQIYMNKINVNKTELRSIVSYVQDLDSRVYLESRWSNLQKELETAQAMLANNDVSDIELNVQIVAIKLKILLLKLNRQAVIDYYY